MKLKAALPASALLLSLFAATGCTAETGTEDDLVEDESDLAASRIQQLGSIAPGETKTASYTSSPLYRSYAFTAKKGSTVDFWVRSSTGDAVAYILRSTLSTVVRNDDADATTRDAHVKAKITADGTYYLVFKEAKSKAATFTVSFAPLTPVDPPPPATNDAFDAASCTGAPLDFVSKFSPGATEAVLGNYQIVLRKRQCNSTTGCTPWQSTTEHAGPSGHGKATLAINPNRLVLVGDEASSAYGTPSIKLGTDCVLGTGTASCNNYYVTETAHGAWPFLVGPRDRHYRVGLDGVGSYHIDGDNVKLAGVVLDHCMRLTAHPTGPDEIYPNAPYNDFEAAILVRY